MAYRVRYRINHPRRQRGPRDLFARLAAALAAADIAISVRDLAGAERWVRLADRLATLSLRARKLPEPQHEVDNLEALRAELRRRYARIMAGDDVAAPSDDPR